MAIFSEEIEKQLPDGFNSLVDGYGKYATEVAISRSIPAIDGFKPSQRRIMYTMYKNKINTLCKSANLCGKVLEYHPHSDASVYETAIPMVDSAEYTQFPFIHGKGNFSKIYFSDKDSSPAASRYTEMCLSDKASTLFGEMQGIEMQLTEDAHTSEPVLLPVSFPSILTTPSSGIAVGLACNIPSFNFNDVLTLTIGYLKEGKVTSLIAPDFNCGGEYILNKEALRQIMLEGQGTIKLRGVWEIDGRDIVITQLPYYARISDILSVARELPGVTSANDETDLHGMKIRVTCSSKAITEDVLNALLRDSKLQMSTGANISVVVGNDIKYVGVIGVIEEWCNFRRGVLRKQYQLDLEKVTSAMRAPKALVELISNQPLKERFLDAMKVSHVEAERVLREAMPDVASDVIDYILDRKLREFADCEARKRQYQKLLDEKQAIELALSDIDAVIIRQLEELNAKYKIPRKTKIVTNDITIEPKNPVKATTAKVVEDYAVSVMVTDEYIKKMKVYMGSEPVIKCSNRDIISILDTKGRLIRIPLSTLPDCGGADVGSYLPTLLNLPRDFKVVDYAIIKPDKIIDYLYTDGYAARLDLSEWADLSRVTRISEKGVAPAYIDKLYKRIPAGYKYLFVLTKSGKLGIADTEYKAKSRLGRTKLVTVDKDDVIEAVIPITPIELSRLLRGNVARHMGSCKEIHVDLVIDNDFLRQLASRKL